MLATVSNRQIRAASIAARHLGGPEHVTSFREVIQYAETILRHMYERAGNAWTGHAGNMATCLLVRGRDVLKMDEKTVADLQRNRDVIVTRVWQQRRPGLSERVSERMMPFHDPKMLRRLFKLPEELYEEADKLYGLPKVRGQTRRVRATQLHEQALMLDMLACDAMRRHDLSGVNIETNLVRDGAGRIVRLWIPGHRTKNGIAIDTEIPRARRRARPQPGGYARSPRPRRRAGREHLARPYHGVWAVSHFPGAQ